MCWAVHWPMMDPMAPKPPVTKEQPDSCMLSRLVVPRPWPPQQPCPRALLQQASGGRLERCSACEKYFSSQQPRPLQCHQQGGKVLGGFWQEWQEVNSQQTVNPSGAHEEHQMRSKCRACQSQPAGLQDASKTNLHQPSPRRSESSESTPMPSTWPL